MVVGRLRTKNRPEEHSRFSDSEQAPLTVGQVKGSATNAPDILEIDNVMGSRQILDQAHEILLARNSRSSMEIGAQPDDAMDRA